MNRKAVVAIDIGYSNLKTVWRASDGVTHKAVRPSGAAPLDDMPRLGANKHDLCGGTLVQLPNGEPWVGAISHRAPQETVRVLDGRYPQSDAYFANFLAGLARTGLTQIDHVVTGLPVSAFYGDSRGNGERLRSRLTGTHVIGPNHIATVKEVIVLPQPVGACLATAGEFEDLRGMTKRVLVLDPGFYSFDHVVIDGLSVRHKLSGTSMKATSTILERAAVEIAARIGAKVSRETLEHMLQAGKTTSTLSGMPVEVEPYLDEAAAAISRCGRGRIRCGGPGRRRRAAFWSAPEGGAPSDEDVPAAGSGDGKCDRLLPVRN
jgi:plasmid segregation protein ParM